MELYRVRIMLFVFFIMSLLLAKTTHAEITQNNDIPKRPTILFNRWQKDWSVLANPNLPRAPLDNLKYIPLSGTNPKKYLSLGANLRNRYEYNNAINFGVRPNIRDCVKNKDLLIFFAISKQNFSDLITHRNTRFKLFRSSIGALHSAS